MSLITEPDWVAAMDANPFCLLTMSAFSDWLQENADPRWEPLAFLAVHGKTGTPKPIMTGEEGAEHWRQELAYTDGAETADDPREVIDPQWFEAGVTAAQKYTHEDGYSHWPPYKDRPPLHRVAECRLRLLAAWVAADSCARSRWLHNSRSDLTDRVSPPPSHAVSKRFVSDLAAKVGLSGAELMAAAADWLREDEYLEDGGRFERARDIFHDAGKEFWSHYAVLTAAPVASPNNFFSCSC